jgi:molybdopterin converting factor subunit 1
MMVQVRYFAVVRERLGRSEEALELAAGATVGGALDALVARHAALAPLRAYLQVAVNQSMVSAEHVLADGDELALIPPVAGGSDARVHARHARLVEAAPSLDACIAAVRGPDAGGIVTFTGMVRARSQGRDVTRLEYEAYPAMAEKVFRELCDEIEAGWPGVRVALEHAVGTLAVGDVAVVIAVAAPHRGEAFRACEATIDRLKQRAPIWKKETGPDGTSWVGMGP